jgi:hypothetical protein
MDMWLPFTVAVGGGGRRTRSARDCRLGSDGEAETVPDAADRVVVRLTREKWTRKYKIVADNYRRLGAAFRQCLSDTR